jgi:hypothetical protein
MKLSKFYYLFVKFKYLYLYKWLVVYGKIIIKFKIK